MDWSKVQALAATPRDVPPELVKVVGNPSRAYGVGCGAVVLGVVALIGSAIALIFTSYAVIGLIASFLVTAVGAGLMLMSRRSGEAMAKELAATLPLALAGVVQANNDLYQPGAGAYAGAVVVFSTDAARGLDYQWLTRTVAKLKTLKSQGSSDPALASIVQVLSNERSLPDMALPPSLTEGVPARLYATTINGDELPGKCLPADGVIPALIHNNQPLFLPGHLWA